MDELAAAYLTTFPRAVGESERVLRLGAGSSILSGIGDLIKDGVNGFIEALSLRDLIDFVKKEPQRMVLTKQLSSTSQEEKRPRSIASGVVSV